MSPAMAARWLIVCVALFGATRAHADRRPVAVINLSSELPARELTAKLEVELSVHPELRTLPRSTDAAALVESVDDDDRPRLERARVDLIRARDELTQFNYAQAASKALEGHAELHFATPSYRAPDGTSTLQLYADLAFELGRAWLGEGKQLDARKAFALVHGMDPNRTLNAAMYLPEVVRAFEQARGSTATTGTLEISGNGHVWIDGSEVGVAPGKFTVPAGLHVVWLIGAEREPRGRGVTVFPAAVATYAIENAEASRRTKVQRARLGLTQSPDPTARASAMKRLAALINVSDAVLISSTNGRLMVQTWRDRAPGFSAVRELGTDKPSDLLNVLAPPRVADSPPPAPPIVIDTTRWYQRTSVRLSIAAGVVAVVVGAVFLSRALDDDTVPIDTDPGWGTPTVLSR
ncbi:MAG: hypothetical protein AB7P03_30485 [Kofleriaceae bacterium]